MGLNEFPPLLGEGLMMKQLPGRAAAVGIFVRAYGSWLSAVLCDSLDVPCEGLA